MRSFAEEKRSGTYELLMTSPLSITEIVLGKFLGAFVLRARHGAADRHLSADPASLYGNPELGVILSGYLGLLLLATAFVSVGLLTSSFTENQIIAAVSCLVALLLLYVISWPADTAGETMGAVLKYLSLTEHFGEMVKGVIDTSDLVVLRQRHRAGPVPHPALGRVAALEIDACAAPTACSASSASSCCSSPASRWR